MGDLYAYGGVLSFMFTTEYPAGTYVEGGHYLSSAEEKLQKWSKVHKVMLEWQSAINGEAQTKQDEQSWQFLTSQLIRFNPSKRWRHSAIRASKFFQSLALPDGPGADGEEQKSDGGRDSKDGKVGEDSQSQGTNRFSLISTETQGPIAGALRACDHVLNLGDFVIEKMDAEKPVKECIPARNARGMVTSQLPDGRFRVAWQDMAGPTPTPRVTPSFANFNAKLPYYYTLVEADQVEKYILNDESPVDVSDPRMLLGGKPKYEKHARDAEWWIKHVCHA